MTTPTTPSDDLEAAAEAVERRMDNESLAGFEVAGYRWETLVINGWAYSYASHWSTPAKHENAERLFTETDFRALLSERLADKARIAELEEAIEDLFNELPDDLVPFEEQFESRVDELGWRIARSTNTRGEYASRLVSAEAALRASQEALRDVEAMLDRYNAPTTDDGDGSLLSLANRIEAKVYADAVAAAKFVADVRIIEPHLDAVICYASDINEHPPNGAVMRIRQTLAQVDGVEPVQELHALDGSADEPLLPPQEQSR